MCNRLWQVCVLAIFALVATTPARAAEAAKPSAGALTVVVMDPLALPLSCPCVKGYAQRDYEKLAERLRSQLGRKVELVFSESLKKALANSGGKADVIIGKHSVVLFDAKRSKIKVKPVAMLEGKDGQTTQAGLIVVPAADPALSVGDLKDYRIVFGPEECEEKHAAAFELLKANGVPLPAKIETAAACDEGACAILEAGPTVRGAAVISSYAQPLLEGCGTIQKGALRIVGETAPVPFIEVFFTESLSGADASKVADALLKATQDAQLRLALETQGGFMPVKPALASKKN